MFKLHANSEKARAGELTTAHGKIQTPIFMPVGTRASVKTVPSEDLETLGAQVILGNTYHLYLRPGHELIARLGGLHKFMSWNGPILTDSGGFQVYSLASLTKKSEEGVVFASHIDGSRHLLTPEKSMQIQKALGSDILMAFDECPALPATSEDLRQSMELTLRWAQRSRGYQLSEHQQLFGIIQGGLDLELRKECLSQMQEMSFDGLAIGGLSVGEKSEQMQELLEQFVHLMPQNKARYLMGIGKPMDILHAIRAGCDMFDCVLPTRNARNGQVFTWNGPLNLKGAKYKEDPRPIDESCQCRVCRRYSRAYLRHLVNVGEFLAGQLFTHHNIYFYLEMVGRARTAILEGQFESFYQAVSQKYADGESSEE